MKRELIDKLHTKLEELVHRETQTGTEFWLARELQKVLGYRRWDTFAKVIDRAITACHVAGYDPDDHFLEVEKMVSLTADDDGPDRDRNGRSGDGDGKPGQRREHEVDDYALTRYACYLVAQNADSAKDPVAFAQTYFAMQTRRQEMVAQRLADRERLSARQKLSQSEKVLSGLIYERVESERGFSRIRTKGDQALFGGVTTRAMKKRLGVPKGRALADFLPTITIKAKDFANEITNFNVKRDYLHTEAAIAREHVKNNREVRQLLGRRRISPEELPAAEDVKKIERRLSTEERKLPKRANHLEPPADVAKVSTDAVAEEGGSDAAE
jgi:DNA-damage-inducible protein D